MRAFAIILFMATTMAGAAWLVVEIVGGPESPPASFGRRFAIVFGGLTVFNLIYNVNRYSIAEDAVLIFISLIIGLPIFLWMSSGEVAPELGIALRLLAAGVIAAIITGCINNRFITWLLRQSSGKLP